MLVTIFQTTWHRISDVSINLIHLLVILCLHPIGFVGNVSSPVSVERIGSMMILYVVTYYIYLKLNI